MSHDAGGAFYVNGEFYVLPAKWVWVSFGCNCSDP